MTLPGKRDRPQVRRKHAQSVARKAQALQKQQRRLIRNVTNRLTGAARATGHDVQNPRKTWQKCGTA
jgi:hypothetical protein